MKTIGEGDVAALLEVVHDAASASDGDPFPQSVLWALTRLIPPDACVGYQEADVSGAFRVVEQVEIVGEQPSPAVEQAFLTLGWQNPMHCRLHARDRRVLRLSDLLSRRQRRRLEYDSEVWRPHGIDDGLRLWLPAPPGRARCIYLERTGAADYTERERTLLALLRPHLIRIRLDAELRRRRNGNHGLTPREEEVLDWIARGKKNEEIARLLFISTHTVRSTSSTSSRSSTSARVPKRWRLRDRWHRFTRRSPRNSSVVKSSGRPQPGRHRGTRACLRGRGAARHYSHRYAEMRIDTTIRTHDHAFVVPRENAMKTKQNADPIDGIERRYTPIFVQYVDSNGAAPGSSRRVAPGSGLVEEGASRMTRMRTC